MDCGKIATIADVAQEKYIVHIDMDAFFASVEQRDNPSIRGQPVIVGADPQDGKGRGVVAACSYEARKYGIHSALPISTAFMKCPQGIYLRPSGGKYGKESKRVFKVLRRFTPDVEPISIDEAFMDITNSFHLFGTPLETCRLIKSAVREETGLTASLGMAPNKTTAKIASDLEKPDGLVIVDSANLFGFLHPLPVEKLWGVGKKTREYFRDMGILTIGDIARQDKEGFIERFGKHGLHIWNLANGIDNREVKVGETVKSVGHEHTFDTDIKDREKILDTLMVLSEKVSRRLRRQNLRGRTVTLKIRFFDFSTYTKAETLKSASNFIEDIFQTAAAKVESFDVEKRPVRLIGVQVSNFLDEPDQMDLFSSTSAELPERKEMLHKALDKIKDRFGDRSIKHRS